MRWPALHLPRLSLDWTRKFWGRSTLLYAAYTVVLFVAFLLLTFPHDLLVRRVLSRVNRGPVAVDFTTVRFAWLNGYEVAGIRVGPVAADNGQPPYLELGRLWVRPALNALARGNPYSLLVRADLYGGDAHGEVSVAGDRLAGTLAWHDLNLGRYRTLTSLLEEGELAGRVSGQLNFEARGEHFNAGQASGELTVQQASLTGAKVQGFGVPDLHVRQTRMKFVVRSGHLEIQEFQATGDVNVQGSGQIVLRDPLPDSVLNLRATVETSLATPDALKGAVALIPRAPGAKPDAPITITGTLAHPRVR